MAFRRTLVACLAATVLVVAFASPVLAECMNWPVRATEPLHVGYAFTATVVRVSKIEDLEQTGTPLYKWRATVDVEDVYRGQVPARLDLRGTEWGCSFLYVFSLKDGDRILVASERLGQGLGDETDLGNVLVWRRTNDRWAFHEIALRDGADREFYPKVARTAKTTHDIVRLISAAALPDTSTAPPDRASTSASLPVLPATFASSLGLLLLLRQRGRSISRR